MCAASGFPVHFSPICTIAAASIGSKGGSIIGECLELEGIASRIGHETRALLARSASKANSWFHQEPNISVAQSGDQPVPCCGVDQQPEVFRRHRLPVDVVLRWCGSMSPIDVGHDLVTIEIKIDPAAR